MRLIVSWQSETIAPPCISLSSPSTVHVACFASSFLSGDDLLLSQPMNVPTVV